MVDSPYQLASRNFFHQTVRTTNHHYPRLSLTNSHAGDTSRSKVLEFVKLSLLIIQEGPCDQNFIGQGQSAFLPGSKDIEENMRTALRDYLQMQCRFWLYKYLQPKVSS